MTWYKIRVNIGNDDITKEFVFVYKKYESLSKEESDLAFDNAVEELNRIYSDYGRFATEIGVCKLFDKFGFERTVA